MENLSFINTENAKKVGSEYRKIFSCDHVQVRVPLPNKYMRFDKAHKIIDREGKLVFISSHFVHGFVFPGTKTIMYKHYYISEEFLGKTIVANITLKKKIYPSPDNRVQYILDIKPQDGVTAKYKLKIFTEKVGKNTDLGRLICLNGKAIGKIACREIIK